MEKYYFVDDILEIPTNRSSKKKVIKYKCLICGYTHDWDDSWTDEKKAEVDAHYNEHIIQDV